MKKILFMIHDLGHGGAEKVLVNLVNNIDKSKFEVTVLSLFGGGINERFLGDDIRYITILKKSFPGNSRIMKLFSPELLHRWFVKDEYDVEIAYLEGPSSRIVSGCNNKKTKLVSWIHCTMTDERTLSTGFRNASEARKCYGRFDKLIFVSDGVKKAFLRNCSLVKDLAVLYNVNETSRIVEMSNEEVDNSMFEDYLFSWCGVGKLAPNKGFDRMIKIQDRLIKEGISAGLFILGKGSQEDELRSLACKCGVNESIKFLGYQTNPYKYVAKCDLFVCASYAEGFSTAATEALIVGTPVCTVEVSGMKEMLGENNEYGLVVENDDEALYQGIKRLITDKELLSYYKQKAIERGKEFSTEETVKAVEEMLESL